MSATNSMELSLVQLIFENAAIANIGDASGLQPSAAAGSLYVGLLTSAPTESADGTAANYTGYARVAVARTAAAWTTATAGDATTVKNEAAITFGACTAGSSTVTHWGIYTASSGGTLLFYGALTSPTSLAVSAGITPEIPALGLVITLD